MIGSSARTLDAVWSEIQKKWIDVTQEKYFLTESDGIKVETDENFHHALEDNDLTTLQLRSKLPLKGIPY